MNSLDCRNTYVKLIGHKVLIQSMVDSLDVFKVLDLELIILKILFPLIPSPITWLTI